MLFCKNTFQTIKGIIVPDNENIAGWTIDLSSHVGVEKYTSALLFDRFPIWAQLTACSIDAAVVLEVGKNPQLSWPWNTLAPQRFSPESTARGWMQNGVQTCQSPPHQWHGDTAGSRHQLLHNSYVPIIVSLTRLILLPHTHQNIPSPRYRQGNELKSYTHFVTEEETRLESMPS